MSSTSVSAPTRRDMGVGVSFVALGMALIVVGCEGQPAPSSHAAKPTTAVSSADSVAPTKVDIIELESSAEPLQAIVSRERLRAESEGRDLLIYVGAEWCEPCKRFHDAAKRGELDQAFPTLRLLELDRDRDKDRLTAAGCMTPMIPLFARPNAEGGCDLDRSMTGSVKGPGAIANITPRLKSLLLR